MVSPPSVHSDLTTRQRLLESAARLFALHGFDNVSLRDLTRAAGANVAAVNYHFGSKEGLMDELVAGFLNSLNEERLSLLDQVEAEAAPNPASLRRVLDALLRPALMKIRRTELSERLFFKLMARCLGDRIGHLPPQVHPLFEQVFQRFVTAISRNLPDLPPAEIALRMGFTVGALIQTAAHAETMEKISRGRMKVPGTEALLTQIITYAEAGFRSPPQPTTDAQP